MAISGYTDDLNEFVFAGEPILPEKDSYSIGTPFGVVSSDVGGGMPNVQQQFFNSPYVVNVNYSALDGFKIAYIEGFLKAHAGQKFVAYLMLSSCEIEPFVVSYVEQPTINKTGFNGSVSLSFLVEPSVDRCFEQFVSEWGQCMGDPTQLFYYANEGVKALPDA